MTGRRRATFAGKADADLSETEWQEWVVARATERGWEVCHHRPAMVRGRWITNTSSPGFPDLTLLRASTGQLVFLELKRERGSKMKPGQAEWIAGLQQVPGVEAYIVKPSDAADVLELLGPPSAPLPQPPERV